MDNLTLITNKILSIDKLYPFLNIWRFQQRKIVFTDGSFDLVRLVDLDYLAKAADMGNKLVIGLNSDESLLSSKEIRSAITDENSRAHLLASLFFVDAVVLFDEDSPYNLIKSIRPDVLVKDANYSIDQIEGSDIVLSYGGEVKTLEYLS